MNHLTKNLLVAFVIFLAITGIFTLLYSPFEEPQEFTLNVLVQKINSNEVESITVKGNALEILLTDGTEARSRKEPESSFSESLRNYGVSAANLAEVDVNLQGESGFAFWLRALLPFILPFLIIGLFLWFMLRKAQQGSSQAMTFGKTTARIFGPQGRKQTVTFADIANVKEAKEELKEVVDFLRTPQRYHKMGARIPRGIILVGAPGTGKTLLARGVSGEANVPFFATSGSEFVEMFVGVGAARVRDLFAQAKKSAPSIIFIDEIDAVGRLRGAGLGGGNDEREQTLNQILSEMDGFERDTGVIVIAATNRPDVLDPALLRPGRFDRRIIVDSPDLAARFEILEIHAKGKPLAKDVDLNIVARRTPGFSGADLANLMNEAAIFATRKRQKNIKQRDILSSIEKVTLGPERKSRIYNKKEKEIAAFHEAGHALVSALLPDADPVEKISIIARGHAGGYTMKLPIEERRLPSRKHFVDELAALLGGYAAEEFQFKDLTIGASDDLKKASELARKMVMQYGMSKKFGPVVFGDQDESVFLGRELGERRNFSENIAHEIDKEVSSFLKQALRVANSTIRLNKKKLEKIAHVLIEQETIEREEFDNLMAAA